MVLPNKSHSVRIHAIFSEAFWAIIASQARKGTPRNPLKQQRHEQLPSLRGKFTAVQRKWIKYEEKQALWLKRLISRTIYFGKVGGNTCLRSIKPLIFICSVIPAAKPMKRPSIKSLYADISLIQILVLHQSRWRIKQYLRGYTSAVTGRLWIH